MMGMYMMTKQMKPDHPDVLYQDVIELKRACLASSSTFITGIILQNNSAPLLHILQKGDSQGMIFSLVYKKDSAELFYYTPVFITKPMEMFSNAPY